MTTAAAIVKHLITLPTGKGALAWTAPDGAHITAGSTVATFAGQPVRAPTSGRLYRVTPDGTTMSGGVPIGRIHQGETGSPYEPLRAPQRAVAEISHNTAPEPVAPHSGTEGQPAGQIRERSEKRNKAEQSGVPARRGGHVAPVELVPVVEPSKPARSTKRRMVVRSFTVSKSDDDFLIRKLRALRKLPEAPEELSESLLIRVGIAFLKTLSDEGLAKHLQDQVKTETKANIGAGRRRRIR